MSTMYIYFSNLYIIDSGNLKITNLDRLIFTKNGEFTIWIELSFFLFLVTLSLKGGEPNEKEITEGDRCFKYNERF